MEVLQLRPAALGEMAGAIGSAGIVIRSEIAAAHLTAVTGESARPVGGAAPEPTRAR